MVFDPGGTNCINGVNNALFDCVFDVNGIIWVFDPDVSSCLNERQFRVLLSPLSSRVMGSLQPSNSLTRVVTRKGFFIIHVVKCVDKQTYKIMSII